MQNVPAVPPVWGLGSKPLPSLFGQPASPSPGRFSLFVCAEDKSASRHINRVVAFALAPPVGRPCSEKGGLLTIGLCSQLLVLSLDTRLVAGVHRSPLPSQPLSSPTRPPPATNPNSSKCAGWFWEELTFNQHLRPTILQISRSHTQLVLIYSLICSSTSSPVTPTVVVPVNTTA